MRDTWSTLAALLISGILTCQALGKQCSALDGRACSSHGGTPPAKIAAVVQFRTANKKSLQQALASVQEAADAIIVIQPRHAAAALALGTLPGAKKMLEHSITWEDSLSEARNAALDLAQDSGATWAMFLDDSEQLQLQPGKPKLAELLAASKADILHCYEEKPYTKPRFVKLPTSSYFDGPTHELLIVDTDSSSSTDELLEGIKFPKQEDSETRAMLLNQDKQLLQQYLVSSTPPPETAARWNYYLAQTLEDLGDPAAAALAYQESALLSANSDEAAWAAFKAAESLHKFGFFSQARELLLTALGKDPTMPELPWLLSVIAYAGERYLEAASWASMSASLGCYSGVCAMDRGGGQEGHRDLSTWFEAPYKVLAAAYEELVDSADAAAEAQGAYSAARQKHKQWLREQEPVMGLYQMARHHLPEGSSKEEGAVKTSKR